MQVNVARCAFLEQGTVQLLTLDVIITFMQGEMIPFRGIPHPNCAYHSNISGGARRHSLNLNAKTLKKLISIFSLLIS